MDQSYSQRAEKGLANHVAVLRKASRALKDARNLTADETLRAEAEWKRLDAEANELGKGANFSLAAKMWLDEKASELRWADDRIREADIEALTAISDEFTAAETARLERLNTQLDTAVIQIRLQPENGDVIPGAVTRNDLMRQVERLNKGEGTTDKAGRFVQFNNIRVYQMPSGFIGAVEAGSSGEGAGGE